MDASNQSQDLVSLYSPNPSPSSVKNITMLLAGAKIRYNESAAKTLVLGFLVEVTMEGKETIYLTHRGEWLEAFDFLTDPDPVLLVENEIPCELMLPDGYDAEKVNVMIHLVGPFPIGH